MTGRRAGWLRTNEEARQDEAITGAREELSVAEPRKLVVALGYADRGALRCCWCDCPDLPGSPHAGGSGWACGKCPDETLHVLELLVDDALIDGVNYPLCVRHAGKAQASISHAMARYAPREFVTLSILDDKGDEIEL